MKQLLLLLLVCFSFNCQAQEANTQLLFKYYEQVDDRAGKSIEALQEEKKIELSVLNEKVKEIKKNRKTNLIAGLTAGAVAVTGAVVAGVAAGKEQKRKNEEAEQARLAELNAQQAAANAKYQQEMAAKGIDVTKTQTQIETEKRNGGSAYTITDINAANKIPQGEFLTEAETLQGKGLLIKGSGGKIRSYCAGTDANGRQNWMDIAPVNFSHNSGNIGSTDQYRNVSLRRKKYTANLLGTTIYFNIE